MSFNSHPKIEQFQQRAHLERGWDPQVTHPGPPPHAWKGNINPDINLKNLIINKKLPAMQSAKTLPTRTTIDSTCSTTPSSFNSIAATFGFSHHSGTDKALELNVLKSILRRESALTRLQDTCTPKYNKIFLQNDTGTGVLDQLTSIREVTVSLIETVVVWRQSQVNADEEIPRPFMYENQNYLLKIMFDMDFLADITPLVEALGLEGKRLRSNPLMMPESLDRANLGKDAEASASDDASGETSGKVFNERLRLRKVEQVLLREMDFNCKGAPSVAWGDDKTGGGGSSFHDSTTLVGAPSVDTEAHAKARQADILGWYRQAQLQLQKLEEGIGEKLSADFNSTFRLKIPVPEDEPLVRMSFSPTPLIPPTSLYELASTAADVPLPGPRSRTPSPVRQGVGIRKLRRLPDQQERSQLTIASLSPELEWTRDDIQLLLELEQAPRCVALACASTLILIASGPQIPKNISWETFCLHANEAPIEKDMNSITPGQIPLFKIRAITPFLGSLAETFEEDLRSQDPETLLEEGQPKTEAIRKLVTWIIQVLNVATSSAEQQARPPPPLVRMSSSQSTIDTIKSRRLESNAGLRRKQGLERAKCPDDMKVKHSETVENDLVAGATITISLEVFKKKAPNPSLKRFVIKVFDENTYQVSQVVVNCKEFSSYLLDLKDVFPGEDVELYFEPASSRWWAKHVKEVVTVTITSQGSMSVKISKKAIRNIVAQQIKSKDEEEDCDLVSQDDEMASQQPLKKENVVLDNGGGKKAKKAVTGVKVKKDEAAAASAAAAAAAKAKELSAKRKREEQEKEQREQKEKEKEKEKEEREKNAAAAADRKKKQQENEEVAAALQKAQADEELAQQEELEACRQQDEEKAAAKLAAEKEQEEAVTSAGEPRAAPMKEEDEEEPAEKSESAKKEEEKEEEEDVSKSGGPEPRKEVKEAGDGYEDEYDADYDDESFMMEPKADTSQKQPQHESESEREKTESVVQEQQAEQEVGGDGDGEGEGDGDGGGDEYEDDNYDDDSFTSLKKEDSVEVAVPSQVEKEEEREMEKEKEKEEEEEEERVIEKEEEKEEEKEVVGGDDDGYDDEFDFEEEEE